MLQKQIDERYMARCIQLAANGFLRSKPNPMVGAVIVCDNRILAEGYHVRFGEGHAEVNAFRAVKPEDEPLLPRATLYVNLEPCSHYGKTPPCTELIIKKNIRRVVVGSVDPFAEVQGRGIRQLREAGIDVCVGVLEADCLLLNRRFMIFHQKHRPYITLKWAQTANLLIDHQFCALAISTPFTQMLVHQLRATQDAILVGKTTDDREHPQLNVRHWHGADPLRLVLTRKQSIESLLTDLYTRNIQTLLVEGGAKTHQAFIDARLWDEIHIETAPFTVVGGTEAPHLPTEMRLIDRKMYDGNTLDTFISPFFTNFAAP